MSSTLDSQDANIPEIVDNLATIIFSPLIVPVAEAVKQPVIRTTIQEGMALSARMGQVVTEASEALERIAAEVNPDLTTNGREKFSSRTSQQTFTDGKSVIAQDLENLMSDINADVNRMTNGVADLRLLAPLALGLFAIGQLIKQGLKFEEIPWYILAWFAFDAFIKLNNNDKI
ncbi:MULTISPECIES: DUF5132 domain-containing protein [unclassified Anabaena]|uniref:DUF5132 domain-containing protein n=1 Tax=unclassified Anabaena TaxID=2619674 RepID=UPI0039C62C01